MVLVVNKERIEQSVFFQEWFWLAFLGVFSMLAVYGKSLVLGVVGMAFVVVISVIYEFRNTISNKFHNYTKQDNVEEDDDTNDVDIVNTSDIVLGTLNNNPVTLPIESLNNMFIIGMTRYGKTRLVMSLITEFINKFDEVEIKLAFSDAKAVSFNVFGRSKHLFAPIAKSEAETEMLIELVLEEMYKRLNLFSDYHEKICTNIDEYSNLSGETLPRIVVIFDEVADSIEPNSQAEKNLTTLAKMGLATGIHLILITQRPTKMGISHEIVSQCQTVMSTYMKNQVEYGSVAKIPASLYKSMVPEKGLFMVFNPDLAPRFLNEYPDYEGWAFMKSIYIDNNDIEAIALDDSSEALELPKLTSSLPAWKGSEDDKLAAIEALEIKLGFVDVDSIVKHYGVGKRTAKKFLDIYNS